jgi:glycosyltransferase involved in cell wall biosynthesis
MLVSVLIPFTKIDKYLLEAIESLEPEIINQKEVILIYDDEQIENINKLKRIVKNLDNVKIVYSRQKGISHCLNIGIKNSSGQFIGRLDSDDLIIPGRFEKQIGYLIENSDCAVVGGQVEFIDSEGQFLRVSKLPAEVNKNLLKGCFIFHPTVLMRKIVLDSEGGYRNLFCADGKCVAEDYELWLRISKNYRLHNLESPVLKYREHSNQSSRTNKDGVSLATWLLRYMHVFSISENIIQTLYKSDDVTMIGEKVLEKFRNNYLDIDEKNFLLIDILIYFALNENLKFKNKTLLLYGFFKINPYYIIKYFLGEIYTIQSWIKVHHRFQKI